jgi:phosphoribosylanthranilate isomerase
MRTRIKICGITRPEDGQLAAQLGADAIGLVFFESSPRCVTIRQAQDVVRALPPFVSVVGLFVNAPSSRIETVLESVALDVLQFHGDEPPQQCAVYGKPFIKAVRMKEDVDLPAMERDYDQAQGLLLDTYVKGTPGGTGQRFDWSNIPATVTKPLILAGGLTPENVAQAVQQVRPYAVDVSGGVESAKGIKDKAKLTAFLQAVRNADATGK